MKVGVWIVLISEMRINTQLENTWATNTNSDILTNRLVLLPVDWDKNGSLFTKRLKLMNKIIG